MIENGIPNTGGQSRLVKKLDGVIADHLKAFEYVDDFTILTFAYMHDALDRLDEKMFGKLELSPEKIDYSSKSTLRLMQSRIFMEVDEYIMVYTITSSLGVNGENSKTDKKFDVGLKRIVDDKRQRIQEFTSDCRQRWIYATAALGLFDGINRKNKNMSDLRLEMRKMILEGYGNNSEKDYTIALKIMNATDRDQLVTFLNNYIGIE